MGLNIVFLLVSGFECPLNTGRIRFSASSGLGNLDVVVLCESDFFLTSFFFAMFESNELVLILVRDEQDTCLSIPGAHIFFGMKKPLGAVLVSFRCGGISVGRH